MVSLLVVFRVFLTFTESKIFVNNKVYDSN